LEGKKELKFVFQFLILGYEATHHTGEAKRVYGFQFLILGYLGTQVRLWSYQLSLSIPHFRIPKHVFIT